MRPCSSRSRTGRDRERAGAHHRGDAFPMRHDPALHLRDQRAGAEHRREVAQLDVFARDLPERVDGERGHLVVDRDPVTVEPHDHREPRVERFDDPAAGGHLGRHDERAAEGGQPERHATVVGERDAVAELVEVETGVGRREADQVVLGHRGEELGEGVGGRAHQPAVGGHEEAVGLQALVEEHPVLEQQLLGRPEFDADAVGDVAGEHHVERVGQHVKEGTRTPNRAWIPDPRGCAE